MMTSAQTSAAAFNNAVDFFFGHNPANPYWALVAMYLRKENALSIVQNYDGDKDCVIAPVADGFDIRPESNTFETYDMPEGVSTLSIVAQFEFWGTIRFILDTFSHYSSNEIVDASKSIFSRKQWDARFLLSFTQSLIDLNEEWYQENYQFLFDKVVHRCFANDHFDNFTQPKEISQVIAHLMGDDYKKVYNPFCGFASYSNIVSEDAEYIGEEIVEIISAVAKLRLLGSDLCGDVYNEDSINNQTYDADLIVSTPPFALPIRRENSSRREDVDTFLLKKIMHHGLRGIVVVPAGINFRGGYVKQMREELALSGCVDMIIALPERLFESTGIATSIYVLNPNHEHKGCIKFVDASHLYLTDNKCRVLDVLSTLSAIRIPGSKSKLVPLEEIKSKDFNFNPSSYMDVTVEVPDGACLMPISELCSIYGRTSDTAIPAKGKVISLSWQMSVNKAKVYTPEDFAEAVLSTRHIAITSPVLIIPMGPVRGIVVDNENETLYSNRDSLHLVVNDSIILPQYLAIQLSEEYVTNQIGVGYVTRVPFDILNRLQIVVPSLDEQRAAIEKYQASLVSKLGIEVDQLKTQQANEFECNMHLRKHALKQVLNEVVPASRRIARFISSQTGDFDKDTIIAERSKATLNEYAQKLFRNVEKIQRLISSLTDEDKFPIAESINFSQFIEHYKTEKITGDRYTIKLLPKSEFLFLFNEDAPNENELGVKDVIIATDISIKIAPSCLETVIDNIIANALNHGFTDERRKDYCIKILFGAVSQNDNLMLEIKVLNNGDKLPIGMSPEKVFTWGVGNGTGLGSWQVKNIIEHFGGSIEFIQYDDASDGYNIEYRILIPMS